MRPNYSQEIYEIAVNTFEVTCYMFPLEEWEAEQNSSQEFPQKGVLSVVGFNGAAEGKMVISTDDELLTAIAANMLGIENPDEQQKTGALCEIANIICGNTVPLFAHDDKICYIQPPNILESTEDSEAGTEGMKKESVRVLLDEGTAEITVYYLIQEEL